ncbi:MAG: hypothetical protein LUF00_01095 [Lachnospiraceae bacterium]|nr:hypothetical protein [Lachnospiraceae bacterium]
MKIINKVRFLLIGMFCAYEICSCVYLVGRGEYYFGILLAWVWAFLYAFRMYVVRGDDEKAKVCRAREERILQQRFGKAQDVIPYMGCIMWLIKEWIPLQTTHPVILSVQIDMLLWFTVLIPAYFFWYVFSMCKAIKNEELMEEGSTSATLANPGLGIILWLCSWLVSWQLPYNYLYLLDGLYWGLCLTGLIFYLWCEMRNRKIQIWNE